MAVNALSFDAVDLAAAVFNNADEVRRRRRHALKIAVLTGIVLVLALFFGALIFDWHFDIVWRYEAVGLLGASVGTAELLSRYRDTPSFVLLSPPGLGYVVINAAASLLALGVILTFGWTFGTKDGAADATQVLMAGFGAMALFRSSLLTVKAGSTDVGIGPSSVLSILMAATDRSADRLSAADRAGRVYDITRDVSYDRARDSLPTVAKALMQNLSPADVAALDSSLAGLESKPLPDGTKALLLGLKITDVVSTSVLAAAKESLGDSILAPTPAPSNGHVTATDLGANGALAASAGLPQTPQTPDGSADR